MDDLYDYLQRSRLFSCLSDVQARIVVENSPLQHVPAKGPIGVFNTATSYVHLVVQGRAKVCYMTPDGKQPILHFVNSDELVGEQAIFDGRNSDNYIETLERSVVASIPTKILRTLALEEPAFATSLSELISRRRAEAEARIRHLLFLSNRERLTHMLLDLAQQYGRGSQHHFELDIKLSHQDLASFIGSTRETVTVVLGKMQLDGLVEVKRRRITLLDTQTLGKSVNRSAPGVALG